MVETNARLKRYAVRRIPSQQVLKSLRRTGTRAGGVEVNRTRRGTATGPQSEHAQQRQL